jgi:hypothetical protein
MRGQADVATNEMQKAANRGVFATPMEKKSRLVTPATMPAVLHASLHGISDEKWERQAGRRKIPAPSVPQAVILADGTNEVLCKKDDITKDEIEFINRVVRPINLDAAEDE